MPLLALITIVLFVVAMFSTRSRRPESTQRRLGGFEHLETR